jgi:uroporphyrin-III C-methyltransferase/precorrin-2 dehydrogenase/sirohydrochlorin ferrochelatase
MTPDRSTRHRIAVGRVSFVGAGPGCADLITVRGLRALQDADVVLFDSLVDPSLLDGLRAELVHVGKRCGKHAMPQEEINERLSAAALRGQRVVRLKGGCPAVLARLGEEVLHVASLGIPFDIVPGVSSVTSAPLHAGIPLTHRGVADSFLVASAHVRRDDLLFSIPPYSPRCTVVLLMALQTVESWQAQLVEQQYPPDMPVAFVSSAGRPEQRVLVTTVARAKEDAALLPASSPTLAVVGEVVRLRASMAWREDDTVPVPRAPEAPSRRRARGAA